ncbi:MAG: lipoprotein [Azoarcus sp.]|jgi:predicted small lipoprotein YifL|nr:lipoprotein [Azoarcus sp.]
MRAMFGTAIFCCVLFLPACGIKGPLYLPPASSPPAAQQPAVPLEEGDESGARGEINPETPAASSHE